MKEKLTAQIVAAYWGASIKTKEGLIGKLVGVFSTHNSCNIELPDSSISVGHLLSECQLILTPLSEMTAEHAIEVGKIDDKNIEYRHRGKCITITRHEFVKTSLAGKVFIGLDRFFNDISYGYSPLPLVASLYTVEQTDYLRSLGYDCGYGSIPSLIEAGIAISSTANPDQHDR